MENDHHTLFRLSPGIKQLLLYGISLAILWFLLQWLEWNLLLRSHGTDLYLGAIALLFTLLGIWLSQKLTAPKVQKVVVEKWIYPDPSDHFQPNEAMLKQSFASANGNRRCWNSCRKG
ncbi:MAG: hypothetical protein IPL65_10980 [Lewinellaceae bacterium]|nr:hypothetical protein [Lewinellaceae bacterium]